MKVLWEDNLETWEPLSIMAKDDPVTLATYAHENNLLDTAGWTRLKRIIKNQKKYQRLVNQAKMKSERRAPIYMFGVQVLRNHQEATKQEWSLEDT